MRVVVVGESSDERVAVLRRGLADAGHKVVAAAGPRDDLPALLERTPADAIVAGAASADAELLMQLGAVDARDPRPVVLFVDDGDADAATLAVLAGVSTYVVNGLAAARVRPVLEVAMARFRVVRELKDEVERGRSALAERKIIERAKGLLMRQRGVGEDEAYRMLRKAAMDQNRRVVEIARSLLAVAEMLTPGAR